MKRRVFFLALAGAALIINGCGKQNPISPALTGSKKPTTLAKPTVTRITFTADGTQAQVVDPGRQFVDDEGVLHIRGFVTTGAPITGDLVGMDTRNEFNANIELATGNGNAWGTFRDEVSWPARNLSGVFEGHYQGQITAGQISVAGVGQGSGDFSGMKISGTLQETAPGSGVLIFNGTIAEGDDD